MMKQALLVIDVQRGLFDAAPRPVEADLVVGRINVLAERARDAGVTVLLIQHEDAGDLVYGSSNWQLEQNLAVGAADLRVRKTTPDSFLGTALQELLTQRGIEQLVVCGYACEFCVDTTVRRAAALGYPVILAADAHTTHDKAHATGAQIRAHHNATLANISSFGPVIEAKPAAEVLFGRQPP
jgi:nicotinamidase-related amidase